jgi:glycosyltransferase involved in cell wall biosynthesis
MYLATNLAPTVDVPPAAGNSLSVCYVLCGFPVLSETFISNEIRAMRALGHRVVPLTLVRHDGPCQPEDEGFRDEVLHLADIPTTAAIAAAAAHPDRLIAALRFARQQTGLPTRSLLRAGAQVALAARRAGCTHIHAHFAHCAAATAIVAAKLAGLTCSFIGHGYDIYGTPSDLPAKLGAVDVALATCGDMAADFRRLAPTANVRIMSCGTDPERFVPVPGVVRNGRLLAVGRLVEQKGYDVLLDALAALPARLRPTIDVVGGGELADTLPARAAALGVADAIRFLGPRPAGWIAAHGPAYLGFVAPYVITRNGDRDTGPLVVKEAMCMGLPVVASALMGLKETVDAQNGRSVPPGDVAALAEALVWLAGLGEAQRAALGAAGRARAIQHHSLRGQAEGLAAAIRSVAA